MCAQRGLLFIEHLPRRLSEATRGIQGRLGNTAGPGAECTQAIFQAEALLDIKSAVSLLAALNTTAGT